MRLEPDRRPRGSLRSVFWLAHPAAVISPTLSYMGALVDNLALAISLKSCRVPNRLPFSDLTLTLGLPYRNRDGPSTATFLSLRLTDSAPLCRPHVHVPFAILRSDGLKVARSVVFRALAIACLTGSAAPIGRPFPDREIFENLDFATPSTGLIGRKQG